MYSAMKFGEKSLLVEYDNKKKQRQKDIVMAK